VSAIGKGDFSRRAAPERPWEPQEIRVLIEEVAATADKLSTHTSNLETLVQERTQALAQVNERLLTLVDALERAGDGIEITDPRARFIYVNPAWEKLTGYSRTEVSGQTPALLRSGTESEAFYEAIWQRILSGEVYSGGFVGKRKDGSLFDQELTVWPVHNRDGELVHIVGMRRDVTEKTRTEQALRISERMASVGTLAAGIAHEVNNPLTYMLISLRIAQAELSRDNGDQPQIREALERAIEGAERVSAIVKELRVFSRPDDRTLNAIDPRLVLDSALRMVDNDIRHRAHLVRDFRAVPHVLGNDARLSQVFLNLLVNAVQALESCSRERSEITVRTFTDESGLAVIEISDTGVGITPEHLNKIFDPFFTTKPVGLGTGLGLSICHGIVKSMNGVIEVESKLGRGSIFRIRLPNAPDSARPALAPVATGPSVRAGAHLRILVVDDDPRVAEAMRQTLARHEVTLADGAESALRAVEASEYDAILCDIMMPGTTGIDLFVRLSELRPSQCSRVIFITGGALTESARHLLERTRAVCLYKPVTGEQLEEALQQLTTTAGASAISRDPAGSTRNRGSSLPTDVRLGDTQIGNAPGSPRRSRPGTSASTK